jgi:cytochrome c
MLITYIRTILIKINRKQRLGWLLLLVGILSFYACVSGEKTLNNNTDLVNAAPIFSNPIPVPEENRFVKETLVQGLREPMELTVTPENNVFWVERKGSLYYYQAENKKSYRVKIPFDVFSGNNDGLIGITLDPSYKQNKFLYLYYSPAGETAKQHLSRFIFREDKLELSDEKVILKIPTQRQECCHSGGSLAFGPDGNLYLGVGDNVSPRVQDGYAPVDEQPGRSAFDAQGTAANTHDLRGKVLRIRPEPDGTYSIPDGNLFPKDGTKGRPEIYVMGARNPIRLSVDAKTGYLYFGDIGPDANTAGLRGPEAYDEINLAKKPGNYGWPYFVGNNKAYPKYDFATGNIGAQNNPAAPINNSPNNTGARILPPVQAPMIYYGYATNPEFPSLGMGGRSAMAGEVYRFRPEVNNPNKFPEYYNNTLFIYDWMRDWIKAVRLDQEGNLLAIEDFMPNGGFSSPMDMQFSADGALYVLEYGKGWYSDNPDAKLVRISYVSGNRPPIAKATASVLTGRVPLEVAFSSTGTTDLDGDQLTYEWRLLNTEEVTSQEPNPVFTFAKPGIYQASLTVQDNQGHKAESVVEVVAGNTQPKASIHISGNSTFYWPTEKIKYQVKVQDAEDGTWPGGKINPQDVKVLLEYSAGGDNLSPLLTAQNKETAAEAEMLNHPGKLLIDQSDCRGCHAPQKNSIGPSYTAIAQRYKNDATAQERLAAKIISGGGGAWDRNFVMVGHPTLTSKAATEMVKYIFTYADEKPEQRRLAPAGALALQAPPASTAHGSFYLMASYQDKGGQVNKPLEARAMHAFRSPRIQAENYAGFTGLKVIGKTEDGESRYLGEITANWGMVYYNNIDLTNVGSITLQYNGAAPGSSVEVRLGARDGALMGRTDIPTAENNADWNKIAVALQKTSGKQDIYLLFKNEQKPKTVLNLDWIEFNLGKPGQASGEKGGR